MASSEQQIYQALTAAGFSKNQAAGVMGNMQNESDFNVESAALDSNGAMSYGLIQWNAASYPNASSLVTGNAQKDLANQVNFLLHNTSGTGQGLQGQTASEVAGNWAQFVEVCNGCQPGGAQWLQRQANANAILGQINSGNWGAGGAGVSGTQNAQTTGIFNSGGLIFPFDIPSILGNLLGGPGSQAGGLTAGIGEGIAGGLISGFASVTNTMLQKLGFTGWKDFFIRMGLIILGFTILIIGLTHLSSNGQNLSVSLPQTASGGGETETAGEASEPSRNASRKTGGSGHPRQSTQSAPKATHGRGGLKTGASSATKKIEKTAVKAAVVA